MSGVFLASVAGIGFGFFQAFNRKAESGFSAYLATFLLLFISAIILGTASVLTEDLSLLQHTSWSAFIKFSLAGLIHFFFGWTFITISQKKVGAARTGALVGATPLFATMVAAVAFDEFLQLPILLGIFLVVIGVYLVSSGGNTKTKAETAKWSDYLFGLGTALCFAISPIFIRGGLEEMSSPILGVTIGMSTSALVYGLILVSRRENYSKRPNSSDLWFFQIGAGIFVGLSTWIRWIALDSAPVAVVLALGRLNVPVVILLSLLLVGQKEEQVTLRVWLGAALVVAGSLALNFFR